MCTLIKMHASTSSVASRMNLIITTRCGCVGADHDPTQELDARFVNGVQVENGTCDFPRRAENNDNNVFSWFVVSGTTVTSASLVYGGVGKHAVEAKAAMSLLAGKDLSKVETLTAALAAYHRRSNSQARRPSSSL
mmetsp:Transcript_8839/g.19156  ORF Transcript_8839/g.19156 Transcript_8839/m.19156 type:complete len:136 (-) Transcript_8839:111-518(-)